jgi:16S rRNA (cytosine967-C5)-methyltransferase
VLARVLRDEAFAAAVLEHELGGARQLDPRDRAFATELVYGSLRVWPWVEERVGRHTKKKGGSIEASVRVELIVAAYQLFFLERVPAFAAVSEAVNAIRRTRGERVAAFGNAILRKVAAEAEAERARAPRDQRLESAMEASVAPWIKEALARSLGDDDARAFLRSGREPPAVSLRVEQASQRDTWMARLSSAAPSATFSPGDVSPHALLARGAGRPQSLLGWAEGAWSVQEEGSQLVALALGATGGERVLDACAGRGNKSAILARYGATVDVADLYPSKLETLGADLTRVGLKARASFAVDWSVGSADCAADYDAVLVDAPCSGLGTLRRRPELATRRTAEKLAELSRLQLGIVGRVSEHVRRGGRLVYAVCSVLCEEGDAVIDALLASRPELELAPFVGAAARALVGEAPRLRLLPHLHGTDGYYVASLRKKC